MTCGIYMIQNKVNGKIYIGQAVDIERRWKDHKYELRGNHHINKHLQSAWNKDGESNFEFTVICECDECQLNTFEQYYIFELMSYDPKIGYNKTYGGGQGGRPTKETREKQSASVRGEKHPNYGKPRSEETRHKISENNYMKGRFGAEHNRSVSVVQLTLDGELENVYGSIAEAGRNGFPKGSVCRCCRGKLKKFKDYVWMYLRDYETLSEETIKEICEAAKGENPKSIPVVRLTLDGELVKVYSSEGEARRGGFNKNCVSACCRGKRKTHGGYKWMHLSDYEAMKKEG